MMSREEALQIFQDDLLRLKAQAEEAERVAEAKRAEPCDLEAALEAARRLDEIAAHIARNYMIRRSPRSDPMEDRPASSPPASPTPD